jgi:hypothetical protein
MTTPRRRRLNEKVEEVIQDGLGAQKSPAQIMSDLEEKVADENLRPSYRTILRRLAAERERLGALWTPSGSADDGLVLELFAAASTASGGQIQQLGKAQGEALLTVHRLAPNLPPLVTWFFAREYTRTTGNTDHIDLALGFARLVRVVYRPRRGEPELGLPGDEPAAHVRIHSDRWPERPFCAWAGGLSTYSRYMRHLGFPSMSPATDEAERRTAEVNRDVWWVWTARPTPVRSQGTSEDTPEEGRKEGEESE